MSNLNRWFGQYFYMYMYMKFGTRTKCIAVCAGIYCICKCMYVGPRGQIIMSPEMAVCLECKSFEFQPMRLIKCINAQNGFTWIYICTHKSIVYVLVQWTWLYISNNFSAKWHIFHEYRLHTPTYTMPTNQGKTIK